MISRREDTGEFDKREIRRGEYSNRAAADIEDTLVRQPNAWFQRITDSDGFVPGEAKTTQGSFRSNTNYLQTHQNDGPHRNGYTGIHQDVHCLANRWNQKEDFTILLCGLIIDFCSDVFQCNGQDIEQREKAKEDDGRRFTGQPWPGKNEETESVEEDAGPNQDA